MRHISKYLTPLYRFLGVAIIATILYALVSLLLNWIFPGTLERDGFQKASGEILGTLCCFCSIFLPLHADPSSPGSRAIQRRGPILIGLVFFTAFVAQILMYFAKLHHAYLGKLWAEFFFTCEYPLLLGVILSLPTRPLSRITSARIVLDSTLIMTAVLTFSWYFLLGPIIQQRPQLALEQAVVTTSLFGDLLLLFCFLILASRSSDSDVQPAKYALLLGITFLLLGDGFRAYSVLQAGATIGATTGHTNIGQQDIFWALSNVALIISTYYMHFTQLPSPAGESKQDPSSDVLADLPPLWNALLPSALVPAVIALVTSVWLGGQNTSIARGVYLGGAMLLGQVVLRQVFSLRETHFYAQKLHLMQQELQKKNCSLEEANIQLEAQATQIEHAYEQQRHLNDLKDQFLLNVNHELRTPLTGLLGYLELLQDYQGQLDPTSQTQFLQQALHGGEELLMLINNMMEAINTGEMRRPPKKETIAVRQEINGVLTHFLSHNQHGHSLRLAITEELYVQADRLYLRQILRNLLSNAVKYSPAHTEIVVRATSYLQNRSFLVPTICISVQDYGDGIPPEELPLLFGKFVRLQRDLLGSVRGTGLGLYICKQLVEAMGGHIWVESAGLPGQGSCFSFTLPAAVRAEDHTSDTQEHC